MVITTPQMLANAIREVRYQKKLSQKQVADTVGTKQSTLSHFENDASGAKIETLFKILASLELELVVQPRGTQPVQSEDEMNEVW